MTSDPVWYRLEDRLVASGGYDIFGEWEPSGSRVTVVVCAFNVLKETPKGVWLSVYGARRFVLRDARKRFACPTIEEATKSFIARKRRQASIHEARATTARKAVEIAKKGSRRKGLFEEYYVL